MSTLLWLIAGACLGGGGIAFLGWSRYAALAEEARCLHNRLLIRESQAPAAPAEPTGDELALHEKIATFHQRLRLQGPEEDPAAQFEQIEERFAALMEDLDLAQAQRRQALAQIEQGRSAAWLAQAQEGAGRLYERVESLYQRLRPVEPAVPEDEPPPPPDEQFEQIAARFAELEAELRRRESAPAPAPEPSQTWQELTTHLAFLTSERDQLRDRLQDALRRRDARTSGAR